MKFQMIAENACMINFEDNATTFTQLHQIKKKIDQENTLPIIETVIGYVTITVYFNYLSISDNDLQTKLKHIIQHTNKDTAYNPRIFYLPVCYDEEFGLDTEVVTKTHSISVEDLIHTHASPTYTVSFLGFSPGFPFLSGLNKQIHTDRKANPRVKVPKGSVGIAGSQTGIYPSQSPGGWQIIGRTPIELLTLQAHQPTLLTPSDKVCFYEISKAEFWQIQQEECQKYVY